MAVAVIGRVEVIFTILGLVHGWSGGVSKEFIDGSAYFNLDPLRIIPYLNSDIRRCAGDAHKELDTAAR